MVALCSLIVSVVFIELLVLVNAATTLAISVVLVHKQAIALACLGWEDWPRGVLWVYRTKQSNYSAVLVQPED
jgi:hypothetical protein